MTQEVILALQAGLPGEPLLPRLSVEDSRAWLQKNVWNLSVCADQNVEEILGFEDEGLFS